MCVYVETKSEHFYVAFFEWDLNYALGGQGHLVLGGQGHLVGECTTWISCVIFKVKPRASLFRVYSLGQN